MNAIQKNPNFAIVKIPETVNVCRFYQLLLEHGFSEVSFVNEIRENAFLPHYSEISKNDSKNNILDDDIKNENENILQKNNEIDLANNTINKSNNLISKTTINRNLFKQILDSANLTLNSQTNCNTNSDTLKNTINNSSKNINVSEDLPISTNVSNNIFLSRNAIKRTGSGNVINSGVGISAIEILPINKTVHHNTQKLVSVSPQMFADGSSLPFKNTVLGPGGQNFVMTGPNTTIDDDGNVYATCLLCHNRIMSSRLSNLTNHVRRHAAMKQYQCAHCNYSHNEMAKVRLHMNHNHKDFQSQPIDGICFEMQLQWSLLMEQCFPDHAKRSKDADVWKMASSAQNSNSKNFVNASANRIPKNVNPVTMYTCVECGEMVIGKNLLNHLQDSHRFDCRPFGCSDCGYQRAQQWKVRLHISVEHAERATEVRADQLEPGNWLLFLHRFFPDIPAEEEEEKMIAQLQEKSTLSGNGNFGKTMNNNEQNEIKTVNCNLCENSVFSSRPLANLLKHAKRHYIVKQFRCPLCSHSCSDQNSMHVHIQLKHGCDSEPVDMMNDELKSGWIETMKRCFPTLSTQVDQFDFQENDFAPQSSKINNLTMQKLAANTQSKISLQMSSKQNWSSKFLNVNNDNAKSSKVLNMLKKAKDCNEFNQDAEELDSLNTLQPTVSSSIQLTPIENKKQILRYENIIKKQSKNSLVNFSDNESTFLNKNGQCSKKNTTDFSFNDLSDFKPNLNNDLKIEIKDNKLDEKNILKTEDDAQKSTCSESETHEEELKMTRKRLRLHTEEQKLDVNKKMII